MRVFSQVGFSRTEKPVSKKFFGANLLGTPIQSRAIYAGRLLIMKSKRRTITGIERIVRINRKPVEANVKQSNSRKLGIERRLVTFSVLAIIFAILWVLLVPMFSYDPLDSEINKLPGTELSHP